MQDNALPHVARVTREYLAVNNIQLLSHPSNSPDLNPEHVWDMMGRRLRNLERPPANLQELYMKSGTRFLKIQSEHAVICKNV